MDNGRDNIVLTARGGQRAKKQIEHVWLVYLTDIGMMNFCL